MESNTASSTPLLSICIPTYNRAEYLRGALENITSDSAFNEDVEIVISDNASTDNTQEVGEEYSAKFSNIRYFRNENNVRDENFILVLRKAQGRYLKLSNDTLRYYPGVIAQMIDSIKKFSEDKGLFFYNNIAFSKQNQKVMVHDVNSFVNITSYFIGWIANFGLWRSDIDCLNVSAKYTQMQFVQVAWTLELLLKHRSAIISLGKFYYVNQPAKKGGYNLFKVQITNLFLIFKDYGLNRCNYELAKYRAFRHLVLPLLYEYVFCNNETEFDLSNSLKTIFKEYWWRLYIYPGLLIARFKSLRRKRK